jgi:hypothetical protein
MSSTLFEIKRFTPIISVAISLRYAVLLKELLLLDNKAKNLALLHNLGLTECL